MTERKSKRHGPARNDDIDVLALILAAVKVGEQRFVAFVGKTAYAEKFGQELDRCPPPSCAAVLMFSSSTIIAEDKQLSPYTISTVRTGAAVAGRNNPNRAIKPTRLTHLTFACTGDGCLNPVAD